MGRIKNKIKESKRTWL